MIEHHARMLPLDKIKFGPLYDQATVLNLATGEQVEIGAAELVPPMLKADAKSAYILEPEFRAQMYLIAMVRQVYPDIRADSMLPMECRNMQPGEIAELLHSPIIPFPMDSSVLRGEYRDVSIFITTVTDTNKLNSSDALNRYMVQALEQDPELLRKFQEEIAEEYTNGQTETEE